VIETRERKYDEDVKGITESLNENDEELNKELWIPGFDINELKSSSKLFTIEGENAIKVSFNKSL